MEHVVGSVYKARREAREEIIDYLAMFYKSNRRHSSLSDLSPADFEKIAVMKKQLMKIFVFTGSYHFSEEEE